MKQVERSHYRYADYQSAARFSSYYYQLEAALELEPETLVEIGVGDGTFLSLARNQGLNAYGLDFDRGLSPSVCGSALQLPFRGESVDVFAAFQVMEHLPFDDLEAAAREMFRCCRKGAVISLPEFGNSSIILNIPLVRHIAMALPKVFPFSPRHRFDGQHHWEIGKRSFPLSRIVNTFEQSGFRCSRTWVNPYWAYHRFFVFTKPRT